MSTKTETRVLLGEGRLNWDRGERITDRYGFVRLYDEHNNETRIPNIRALGNMLGRLEADVLRTRQSRHIGDLFRGIFPETPSVGETILLGTGRLVFGDLKDVGLVPEDGRTTDWLDPRALYRAHDQYVRLYFVTAL